jgi:spermidine/putrescine-binding protein
VTKLIRIIASTTLFVIAACGGDSNTATGSENLVNIYNWADAIAPGVIEQFESETGISVNYDTYATSATIDVKLLTGNSGKLLNAK